MVVGFIRRKSKSLLSSETALDRKGKVDGSSLLDGDGEPNSTSLYVQKVNGKIAKGKKGDPDHDDNNVDPIMMNQNPIFQPQNQPPPAFGFGNNHHNPNPNGYPHGGGYGNNQYPSTNGQYPQDYNQPPYPPFNNQPTSFGSSNNYPSSYMPQPEQETKTRRSWFGRKK